jgi:hypothetical protein
MRLLFVIFALGPAMFFYSLAYLMKHPADWMGPAVLLPVSLAASLLAHLLGLRWIRRETVQRRRTVLVASQLGGIVTGIAVFIMILYR